MNIQRLLGMLVLVGAATAAWAQGAAPGPIEIGHPYTRPTREGQRVGGGFLTLTNKGAADRLLSAATPAADTVEIHTMTMEGDVMKMRQLDALALGPGQTVELKPGGYHLMLMGLKAPLRVGDQVPLTLKFEKGGEKVVTLRVEAPSGDAPAMPMHKH